MTPPAVWWEQRRPEIVEDLECAGVGRGPKNLPKITWRVVSNVEDGVVEEFAGKGRHLVGQVDNSAYPEIEVDVRMTLVTPAAIKSPVPV